jgi:hypothetical protein
MDVNFIIEGNWSTQRKPQVTDKLYQIMYRMPLAMSEFEVTDKLYQIMYREPLAMSEIRSH